MVDNLPGLAGSDAVCRVPPPTVMGPSIRGDPLDSRNQAPYYHNCNCSARVSGDAPADVPQRLRRSIWKPRVVPSAQLNWHSVCVVVHLL